MQTKIDDKWVEKLKEADREHPGWGLLKGFESSLETAGNVVSSLGSVAGSFFVDTKAIDNYRISLTDLETTLGGLVSGIFQGGGIGGIITDLTNTSSAAISKVISSFASLDAAMRKNMEGIGGYYGEFADAMRDQTLDITAATQGIGVGATDVINGLKSLSESSGRMALYGTETMKTALTASAAFTKSNTQILENAENFRNVGLGLADAGREITKIGEGSLKLGLNAKEVSDTVIKSLDKMNQFGFKNGVEGLGRMVQQAQSLNIDINKTLSIAEKLFDPSQAIDLSANLQALGGAFGDFADPIKLMYDATNNVENLQDSLIGAAKNLATYNAEQGRFEVSGANLRRANEMAKTLGMSTGDLTNMAVKAASKFEALSQLDMFPSITNEQKEFLSNLTTMKEGKIGFDIPKDIAQKMFGTGAEGGFKSIDEMAGHMDEFMKIQKQMSDMKPEDLARAQYNAITNILDDVNAIAYHMGANVYRSDTQQDMRKIMSDFSKTLHNELSPEKIKEAEKSPGGITELAKSIGPKFLDAFKNLGEDAVKGIFETVEGKTEGDKTYNSVKTFLKDSIDKIQSVSKPIFEKGKEVGKDLFGSNYNPRKQKSELQNNATNNSKIELTVAFAGNVPSYAKNAFESSEFRTGLSTALSSRIAKGDYTSPKITILPNT